MKHIYLFLFTLFIGSFGFGQGTETFENICTSSCSPSNSSYGSRSWTGVDGSTWTATNSRTDQTIVDEAMTMNDDKANTYVQSGTISGGVGDITITTQRQYSGGSGTLDVLINGISVGTVPYSGSIQTTTISGVNITSDIIIRIDNNIGGSSSGGADRVAVDNITWTAAGPTCTAPTTQASAYSTTALSTTSATLNWTSGDGEEVLVLVKEGSAVDTDPESGTAYTSNTVFTSGDELGTGNYAVYSGSTTNTVDITDLSEATTYHVAIYEYNTTDTCYNLTALTSNFTTGCSTPSDVSAFSATEGNTTVDLSWTNGSCYDDILVVAKATSAVSATPTGDGTSYTANAIFGSGSDLGTDEYVVYKGTGTAVTITGLTNGTTYHFEVFARKATTWSAGVTANAVPDLTWCTVSGNTSYGTSTTLVNFGSINKVSGAGSGYDDFTSESTDAIQGSDIDLTVNLNTAGNYTVYAKAWIDWNQDGTFNTSTEEYTLGTANGVTDGPTTLSPLTISVPAGATLGNTRMRVVSNYNSYTTDPCGGTTDGEIEDYTVNVLAATTDTLVQFTSASTTVAEDVGTHDLEFSITNEDALADTTFEVVLLNTGTGSAIDIDNYTTQTVTFSAGSSANKTLVLTITDDLITETDETLIFEIQNIDGGTNASVGSNSSFTLTILESDPPCSITNSGLANISCNDNGTPLDASDDITSFELNPTGEILGATYSVDTDGLAGISTNINGPYSNTVISGISYGAATTFYLEPGSAGIGGDIEAFVIGVDDVDCFDIITITDPESCSYPPSIIFEDFEDGNFTINPIWTGSTSDFSVITDATIPSGSASTDGSYLASNSDIGDVSLIVESTETTEWEFSLGSPNFSPSGANYFGVVLMASTSFSGSLSSANFQGYYLRIGVSGSSPDEIELWRKTGAGQVKVGNFPSSPDFGAALTNGLNIKVTRSELGEFELFYSTGFELSETPTTSAGTLTNDDYDTSAYFGVYQEFTNTSSSRRVYFDNLSFAPETPETYTFNGTWSPNDPNDVSNPSTSIDTIEIISGNAIISANTTINTVTVDPAASLTIDSGVTLTVNDEMLLSSTSTSFSSLILDGTITGTVKYSRYVNSNGSVNGNDLISAPLTGQAFDAFIANNPNIRANPNGPEILFGGFDNDSNTYEIWNEEDNTTLNSAVGYRTGITSSEDNGGIAPSNLVTFEGTVNAGLVQIAIDQGTSSQMNLIGNPYPSYLSSQKFLNENSGLLDPSAQVLYGYNDSTDGSSANDYTIIGGFNQTSIAPGQAFFVASNATGGNIQFTTSSSDMRLATGGDDFIIGRNSAAIVSNIKLNLSNANDSFKTDIYFTDFTTQGLDPSYDASLWGGTAPSFSIYTHLVQENAEIPFAVQALGETDFNNVTIPLGVNANEGEQLSFTIETSNLPDTVDIYLDDTTANTSTLLNTSDYTLTPNTTLNGVGRFYLRFANRELSTQDASLNHLSIFNNEADKTIVIAGQLVTATTAKLYDMQGRLVDTKLLQNTNSIQTIDVSRLNAGVYVVQLANGRQNKTQKVIIH